MRMKKNISCLLLIVSILIGCASTRFHSISNMVVSGTSYQKFIVHSNIKDIDSRKTVEDAVVKKFQAFGVTALQSYTVFPPGANTSLAEKEKTIQSLGFDAALLIKIINSTVTQTPVTQMEMVPHHDYAVPQEQSQSTVQNNTAEVLAQNRPAPPESRSAPRDPSPREGQRFGGRDDQHSFPEFDFVETVGTVSTAHFKIKTELLETRDFKAVWTALTGSREGSDDAGDVSLEDIMDSYGDAIVGELKNEGILGKLNQIPVSRPPSS
jgi:hypothetical protein